MNEIRLTEQKAKKTPVFSSSFLGLQSDLPRDWGSCRV